MFIDWLLCALRNKTKIPALWSLHSIGDTIKMKTSLVNTVALAYEYSEIDKPLGGFEWLSNVI